MIPAGLTVVQVLPTSDTITIVATSDAGTAACPSCGGLSQRVHSTYQRQLQDLPWQGHAVVLQVRARRFRCSNPACARRTFVEPLSGTTVRRTWRTCRLGDLQRHIGLAAGGEAGARLAQRLSMPVSPDTLLRLVARFPEPACRRLRFLPPASEPGAKGAATAPCWLILNATGLWTCCPTGRPKRGRPGCANRCFVSSSSRRTGNEGCS